MSSHNPQPTTASTGTSDSVKYLSYRLTLGIEHYDRVEEIIGKYCGDYLIYPHCGDNDIPNPHYHIIVPTEDPKLSDRFKMVFCREYNQKGNGFHSGKYHTNGLLSAVSYCIHDKTYTPRFKGAHWETLLRTATPFVKNERAPAVASVRAPRVKLGAPVLTLGNLVKQALLYRERHGIVSRSLYFILFTMVGDGWTYSRDIAVNGVPAEFYDLWDSVTKPNRNNNATLWCLMPHVRNIEKNRFKDDALPNLSRYND